MSELSEKRIIGHVEIRRKLKTMESRFPNSLILSGMPGIGKKLVAFEIARYLTGDDGAIDFTQPLAQTECLYFISPDGTGIKIEQVREALRFQSLSREGKKLFFIFDEAQLLTAQAGNALLKSIEEPPPGVHFIFITPSSSMLLATIRSRSQVVQFSALDESEVLEVLKHQIGHQIVESKDHSWILEMGRGSPGMILDLLSDGESPLEEIHHVISQWLEAVSRSQPVQGLQLKNVLTERTHHQLAFRVLVRLVKRAWQLRALQGSVSAENSGVFGLNLLGFDKLEKITDLVLESEADLNRNVDRQLIWDQLTSRMREVMSG